MGIKKERIRGYAYLALVIIIPSKEKSTRDGEGN
jgi:hypothetical protein